MLRTRLAAVFALSALSCTHASPLAPVGEAARAGRPATHAELAERALALEQNVLVNNPVLAERGAELRAALADALSLEGFRVVSLAPGKRDLLASISIDYTAWTSVSPASLYVWVALTSDGTLVDQTGHQKVNEAFPEKEHVGELARALAHALAISPRTAQFLRTGGAMPVAPQLPPEQPR